MDDRSAISSIHFGAMLLTLGIPENMEEYRENFDKVSCLFWELGADPDVTPENLKDILTSTLEHLQKVT